MLAQQMLGSQGGLPGEEPSAASWRGYSCPEASCLSLTTLCPFPLTILTWSLHPQTHDFCPPVSSAWHGPSSLLSLQSQFLLILQKLQWYFVWGASLTTGHSKAPNEYSPSTLSLPRTFESLESYHYVNQPVNAEKVRTGL